jgi:hypothetical protein
MKTLRQFFDLREAGVSSAAVDAAEMHRIAADMLRCMAGENMEPAQLGIMNRAYNLWLRAAKAEAGEIGTDGDELQPNLYEAADGNIGEVILLQEKALKADGTVPIKIISPGWGTTGYYGDRVLEKFGPKAFPKGTHMYWDHPTETEAKERPERSLDDLAAVLVSDARYDKDGIRGPGLYADAKVTEAYKGPVDDLATHIGTSIRAFGAGRDGEAEGRKGPIIESIIPSVMNSIDFVTLPGAGGQVVSLFEAARGRQTDAGNIIPIQEAETVPDDKDTSAAAPASGVTIDQIQEAIKAANAPILTQLQEAQTANSRLQEALILRDARDIVRTTLDRLPNVPDMTKARLQESLSINPPAKDGAIDAEAFTTKITEAVQAELEYLNKAAGTGRVQNMGSQGSVGEQPKPLEESQKSIEQSLLILGLSETAAKLGAAGRN